MNKKKSLSAPHYLNSLLSNIKSHNDSSTFSISFPISLNNHFRSSFRFDHTNSTHRHTRRRYLLSTPFPRTYPFALLSLSYEFHVPLSDVILLSILDCSPLFCPEKHRTNLLTPPLHPSYTLSLCFQLKVRV